MALVLNGSANTIAGVAAGGINDNVVDNGTMADDAIGVAELSATGTASSSTYLRGDNAWSAISAGITEADTWRLTAHTTSSGGGLTLTSNWERNDSSWFGKLGTGMSESSGVFTFPSTGIWEVSFFGYAHDTGSASICGGHISPTVDGGSNYTTSTSSYFHISNLSTYTYGSFYNSCLLDITDTSTHKTRFYVYSDGDVTWEGSTSTDAVSATFKRLGDT